MACVVEQLAHGKYFVLTRCATCKKIHLRHHCYVLDFDNKGFIDFCDFVNTLDFQTQARDCSGTNQLFIRTTDSHIKLCLVQDEFDDLREAMDIARIVINSEVETEALPNFNLSICNN